VLLALNIFISLCLLLILVFKIQRLSCIIPALSAFIKLFPYLFCVATFNLCCLAIFSSRALMIRMLAIANLPFLLGYLLLHEFINESLKFREVDFCNRRVGSNTEVLLIPAALVVL
jgi:hypothetical protein